MENSRMWRPFFMRNNYDVFFMERETNKQDKIIGDI